MKAFQNFEYEIDTNLGGSGAWRAIQVKLISDPARTNSSGPDNISAFDTETTILNYLFVLKMK